MAVLLDADRVMCHAEFMQELSRSRQDAPLNKADLRAAVDAIDTWISSNAAAFNAAIPQPARAALTSAQKAQLFAAIVDKRFIKGV